MHERRFTRPGGCLAELKAVVQQALVSYEANEIINNVIYSYLRRHALKYNQWKPCSFQNTSASSTAERADMDVNNMSHGLSLCSTACKATSFSVIAYPLQIPSHTADPAPAEGHVWVGACAFCYNHTWHKRHSRRNFEVIPRLKRPVKAALQVHRQAGMTCSGSPSA